MSEDVQALSVQSRLLESKRRTSPAPPSKMSFPIFASEALSLRYGAAAVRSNFCRSDILHTEEQGTGA
jgi:hypothetical protein